MTRDRFARSLSVFAIGFVLLMLPTKVLGHCDGMDGPVVQAAQRALAKGDVNLGLTMEHQKGRLMVGEVGDAIRGYAAGEPPARENLVRSLRALVAFYPSHIWKEDYLLFPLAGRLLRLKDQQALAGKFEEVEHELGHEVRERFEKLAAKLELEVSGVNPR